jgi:glycosyltransferase involved in cell wall biosynthesis
LIVNAATPDFSIVIPCHNDGRLAVEAIDSCLRQSHPSLEVVFVDDGSTDDSLATVSVRFARDFRVRCLSKASGGLSSARNAGLRAASGRFLVFLDSDDLIGRDYLLRARSLIRDNAESRDLVYVMPFEFFSERDCARTRTTQRDFLPPILDRRAGLNRFKLALTNCFPVSSVVVPRELLDSGISFDENLPSCEDWDLWIRISRLAQGFVYAANDPGAATAIRVREGMSSNAARMEATRVRMFRKNFKGTAFMVFMIPVAGDLLRNWLGRFIRARNRRLGNSPNVSRLGATGPLLNPLKIDE